VKSLARSSAFLTIETANPRNNCEVAPYRYFRGADHREFRTMCTTLTAIFLNKLTGACFASGSMLKDHALPDFTHRSVGISQHMGLGVEFHHVSILRCIPWPRRETAAIRISGPSKGDPGILRGEGQC
jgi:hypothetical protein